MSGFGKYAEILKTSPSKRRRLGGESGSALVEMALCSALIFALFFGIIEIGFGLYSYQYVDEVARNLTRYAIVRGSSCSTSSTMPNCGFTDTSSTLQTYARSTYAYPGITMGSVSVTNTWYTPNHNSDGTISSWTACASGTGCNGPGDLIKVTVSYPYLLSIPFWSATTLNISSSSSMVISQ